MPEGPLGFKRLTGLGPLVSKTSSDIAPPSFKTKTFRWDGVDFKFTSTGGNHAWGGELEQPGGRGVERGSSFSLDGVYMDKVGARESPSITYIYPLHKQKDIPFFYLNPSGKMSTRASGRRFVAESPTYFTETEVAIRDPINVEEEVEGVCMNIGEDYVEARREEKLKELEENEDAEKYGWKEEGIRNTNRDADWAIETIEKVKDRYNMVNEVPKTEFRDEVLRIANDLELPGGRYKENWSSYEKGMRPIHKTIAEMYDMNYGEVVEQTREMGSGF